MFLVTSDKDGMARRGRGDLRSCELPRADGRRTAVRVLGARFDATRVGELPIAALEEMVGTAKVDVVMVHSGAASQEERESSKVNLAVQQLRHLQREVAQSEGVPVLDFGRLVEGYQFLQDGEHLSLNPAGVVYAQAVVHQLRLALERRSSWRRGWLWDS
ncbi:hypothetical protein JCM8208_002668 [Rhodotorula glutinis]